MAIFEQKIIQDIQRTVEDVNKIRQIGKEIISSLIEHVTKIHSAYLEIKDQKDLRVTLEYFGNPVLVEANIILDPVFQDINAQLPGGEIIAWLLPEKEKGERMQLFSFNFDYLGNVKNTLAIDGFPIYFIKELIDKLFRKGLSIS